MRTTLLFVFLGTALLVSAQSAGQDLQKVLKVLTSSEQLYYENIFLYYEDGETKPSDTLTGIFHRNGSQEYVRIGQTEVFDTGTSTVIADHEDRLVAIRPSTQTVSLDKLVDADQLLGMVETQQLNVEYTASGKTPGLTLVIKNTLKPDESMEIRFDPMTSIIQQIKITTADPFANPFLEKVGQVAVEIQYIHLTTRPQPFRYSIGQYIQPKGNTYTPAGKCKGYTLL